MPLERNVVNAVINEQQEERQAMIHILNVFENIVHQFWSYLRSRQLRNISAKHIEPNPETPGDCQLRIKTPLEEPGLKAVEIPPKSTPLKHFFNQSTLVRGPRKLQLLGNFLQRNDCRESKVKQGWVGTPRCEIPILYIPLHLPIFDDEPDHCREHDSSNDH